MANRRELKVVVLGDATSAQRALSQLNGSTTTAGNRLKAFGATAKLAFAGAGFAAVQFGRSAISAATESRKAGAQTAAVIKSTGGAAKVTAKHVGDLASELQKMSGVQDEAIQAGANMLLTFTNIRNEAGEGNDVFDQATRTLLDMSVALGTDAKTSAIQLGKALQDPIKGVSALQRVGVTFTAEQKATIRAMVEMGDTAGAQKLILAELNREFGGSAKAAGDARDPMEKLSLAIDDLKEAVGERLLVALENLSAWWERNGPFIKDWFGGMSQTLQDFGGALYDLSQTFLAIQESIGDFFIAIADWANDAADAVGGFVDKLNDIPGAGIAKKIGGAILDSRLGALAPGRRGSDDGRTGASGSWDAPSTTTNNYNQTNNIDARGQDPEAVDRAIARGWRRRGIWGR